MVNSSCGHSFLGMLATFSTSSYGRSPLWLKTKFRKKIIAADQPSAEGDLTRGDDRTVRFPLGTKMGTGRRPPANN